MNWLLGRPVCFSVASIIPHATFSLSTGYLAPYHKVLCQALGQAFEVRGISNHRRQHFIRHHLLVKPLPDDPHFVEVVAAHREDVHGVGLEI